MKTTVVARAAAPGRRQRRQWIHALGMATVATLALFLLRACSASDSSTGPSVRANGGGWGGTTQEGGVNAGGPTAGSAGFVAPGAADFARFRALVAEGKIPAPEVLDDLGFFAEHKIDLPAADCGEALCVHARPGFMGNLLTGNACTIVQIGLNSPLDPATMPRPPLHMVVAIDLSGQMPAVAVAALREGLQRLLLEMSSSNPEDLLTIVGFGAEATVRLPATKAGNAAVIQQAIDGLMPATATANDLYAGLVLAREQAEATTPKGYAARVVLLSNGHATVGITSLAKARALVAGGAKAGIGLTAVAVGSTPDSAWMQALAEAGQGNLYVIENDSAIKEVFVEEARTAMFPIASDVIVRLNASDVWAVRGVYGARDVQIDAGGATIRIPALFLAHRKSAAEPISGGRRGGGGVIQVELMPLASSLSHPPLQTIGGLAVEWRDLAADKMRTQASALQVPGLSAEALAKGLFSSAAVEKGFMMLQMYVGMRMACALTRDGDPGAAQGVLEALDLGIGGWLQSNKDADIADDRVWASKLHANIKSLPATKQTPVVPAPDPWPMGD